MVQTASRNGTLFIACREALVLVAYPDPSPERCSAGFGHQAPGMRPGDPVTLQWAFSTLKEDVAKRSVDLSRRLKVSLQQHEFDALLSLYYQSGTHFMPLKTRKPGDAHYGDPDVLSLINAGNLSAAADLWPSCDENAAGGHMPGLRLRRLREQAVLVHGDYGDLTTIPFWPGNPRTTRMQTYTLQLGDI